MDWGVVADVRMPLQALVDRHQADLQWQHRPLEGGWVRGLALRLDSGRMALLDENRDRPGEFSMYLLRHRDRFFFKEDYAEVLQFLAAPGGSVTLFTGQVHWWKPKHGRRTPGPPAAPA